MTRDQLIDRIKNLTKQVYSANTVTPEEAIEYDELTKFPELKKVIVDLLTLEYDNFYHQLIGLPHVLLHSVLIYKTVKCFI